MKIAIALSLLLLLADTSRADATTTAATQPVGKKLPQFRDSGHLNQLMLMRTSVSEIDLDEEVKTKALAVMDKFREDILALVAQEETTPSEKTSRDASMTALITKFRPAMEEIGVGRGIPGQRIVKKTSLILHERVMLEKGETAVLEAAEKLQLSDEQQEKIKEALKAPEPKDREWLPPMERAMADSLARRERFRAVLSDEQKQKWDELLEKQMNEQQRSLNIQGGANIPRRP